jgi:RNA polymerase sigma-70 factor (ECF subfamily)
MSLMPGLFKDICHLINLGADSDLTDRQLLERFSSQGDDQAFALLVHRHGPMVLGVCRRVLNSVHDAEDAFQATFMVLARKAGLVRWQESIGGWLVPVALHLALKMKAQVKRRRSDPTGLEEIAAPVVDTTAWELRGVLDEELGRLPEKYRAAVVLCHCQGRSRAEAAQELGWKPGALKIRLERAHALLRARLTRRGIALSTVLVISALADASTGAVPSAALAYSTVTAAQEFAAGRLSRAAAATVTAQLVHGALKNMNGARYKFVMAVGLILGLLGAGAGIWLLQGMAFKPPSEAIPDRPAVAMPDAGAANPEAAVGKPLRVLLVSDAPTREFQFLRQLLVRQVDRNRAELSIFLQSAPEGAVQDVPAERMLQRFPHLLQPDPAKVKADEKAQNLLMYDVVVAFDPDWRQVPRADLKLLKSWVEEHGGGLIVVAGPVHTCDLAFEADHKQFDALLDLLPVVLENNRMVRTERSTARPRALHFPGYDKVSGFLKLDGQGNGRLAGWSEFFYGKPQDDVQDTDTTERGFYTFYPITQIRPAAVVIATYAAPEARYVDRGGAAVEQPYLVSQHYGKGTSIYLSAGELWRLRTYSEDYYDHCWSGLLSYAASEKPFQAGKDNKTVRETIPAQRMAIERGLKYLAEQQFPDGHWEIAGGGRKVGMTSLAGMAFVMEGSTLTQGNYQKNLHQAMDYLTRGSRRDGNSDSPSESVDFLIGNGFKLLFLASLYGEEEDSGQRGWLRDMLIQAVDATADAQQEDGGWGQVSIPDSATRSRRLLTVIQVQALRAGRAAGVPVPSTVLGKAQGFLEKKINVDPTQVETWAALAGSFAPDDYQTPLARKWLHGAEQRPPVWGKGEKSLEDEMIRAYHAQVRYALGEEGYGKLFPDSKPEQRLTWLVYRNKSAEYLAKTQKADGSWGHPLGSSFATAVYLTILQLDKATVPIYQR